MTASQNLKASLDALDEQLVGLLEERLAIARELGIPNSVPDVVRAAMQIDANGSRPRLGGVGADPSRVGAECEGSDAPSGSGLGSRALAIDHAAIAVRDLPRAVAVLCERFGFHVAERRQIEGKHSGMDSVVLRAGPVKLVLVQGTSPESNVSRYIEHYGPGVQHLAIEVDDAQALHAELCERECDLLTGVIHGAGLDQVFTRRDPHSGMQLEFVTRTENDGFSPHNVRELFEAMEREDSF